MLTLVLALALTASDGPPVAYADEPPVAFATPVARTVSLAMDDDAPVATPSAPPKTAPAPPPTLWSRVDSRGGTWTHPDRAYLDAYVDAVERSYAAHGARAAVSPATIYRAPYGYGMTYGYAVSCASGACAR